MKLSIRLALLTAWAILASASAAPADEDVLAAGGKDGAWIVRRSADKTTLDVLHRPVGGKWKWIANNIQGSPAAIADAEGRLHVLMSGSKGYLVFGGSSDEKPVPRRNPQSPCWPADSNPKALCDATGLALPHQASILAIVEHPYVEPSDRQAASRPASQPASRSASSAASPAAQIEPSPLGQPQPAWLTAMPSKGKNPRSLAIFVNVLDQWKHLADLGPLDLTDADRVLAAVAENALYVLIAFRDGQCRLAVWKNYGWTELLFNPPRDSAACRPVAMLNAAGKLAVVWKYPNPASHPAGQKPSAAFLISVRDEDGTFLHQEITQDGNPANLSATAGPFFVGLNKYIGVVWRQGEAWKFALCQTSGRLQPAEDASPSGSPAGDGEQKYLDYFMFALMACIFAVMFLVRPRKETKPFGAFILPPQISPAGLGKRLAAGLIDMLPFFGAAFLIFPTDLTLQELFSRVLRDRMPDNLVLAAVSGCGSYGVYCIIMEKFFDATIGKMIFGLKVVGNDGKPADTREVLLRNLIKVMEISTFWLLLLIPLFNRNRQRLADLIARTAVVDKRPVQPPAENDGDYI
ncbi:MAG: RDD family protein [Planctomycetes bacterium]|nr:RDD family protein [Planctomycetota bacterium]